MGFMMSAEWWWMIRNYRVAAMAGRFGSGKTLLAMAAAVELWRQALVTHVYSNLTMKGDWQEELPSVIRDAVIVFDEAWIELDSRSWSRKRSMEWLAYLRKRNIYLLLASVTDLDVRFRRLTVYRSMVMPKIWRYTWMVNDGMKPVKGSFLIQNPSDYFQVFDTLEEPSVERAAEIRERLAKPGFPVEEKSEAAQVEAAMDADTLGFYQAAREGEASRNVRR